MSSEEFGDRVREVLDLALERPAHEREAFVAGVCGADERLRDEVVSLLRALHTGGDALEPPPVRAVPAAEPLTGLKFGPYQVAERVGEGGMGVVYRAQDTRLGRTVAVKALPASVARDTHGRARFEHEARVLASLNHPHIAAIYGVEDTARGPVMVLEFVPGESLARHLGHGSLATDEALAIAVQIARGLEAAHAAGVVHRDLKPANIQLSAEGGVKILDFGIAKQGGPAPAAGSDADPMLTAPGGVIGTAGYMSPEQARGRPVDRRADLWAFGCVLYEMLSGRRAFEGDTTSDTVAAVLRADPDWARLPPQTPPAVARLLRRCLQKDPDRRQRDAGDARLELEATDAPRAAAPPRPRRRLLAWGAIGTGAMAVAFGAGVLLGRDRPAPTGPGANPVRFAIDLSPTAPLSFAVGGNTAVSPDGRTLVYSAGPADRSVLYLRSLDSVEAAAIPGTEGAVTPFFSPDGRSIGFVAGEALKSIPVAGGAPGVIATGVGANGCSWGPDGRIVFTPVEGMGLRRIASSGGEPEQLLTSRDAAQKLRGCAHPDVLPGGNAVLYTGFRLEGDRYEVCIEALLAEPGGTHPRTFSEQRVLVPSAACGRFLPPDRLLYWQAGSLMLAPFDAESVRVTGDASVVVRPVAGGEVNPMPRFAVGGWTGGQGVLAWLPGNVTYDLARLAWFDLDGTSTIVTEGGPSIDGPRLSPDGTKVAVMIGASGGDVWVHDLARSTRIRLTTGDCRVHGIWTHDGRCIVCTNGRPGQSNRLESMAADGTGTPDTLLEVPEGTVMYATDAIPDCRSVLLTLQASPSEPLDVFVFDTASRAAPHRLLPQGPARYGARISPDGAMIAYTSEETGNTEVYLHRYPALGPKICVTTDGGYRPVWSRDGKQLFFRYLNRLSVVDVDAPAEAQGPISLSGPRVLFEHLPDARYEVSADGRRFLMARPSGDWGPQTRINIATGWTPR